MDKSYIKFKIKHEDGTSTTVSTHTEATITDLCQLFKQFLSGAGYYINPKTEVHLISEE